MNNLAIKSVKEGDTYKFLGVEKILGIMDQSIKKEI